MGRGSPRLQSLNPLDHLVQWIENDPAAGSPTATLLRLLPLLDCEYCPILTPLGLPRAVSPKGSTHNPLQATTGGVYKNQGRIRCVLMKRGYKTFLVHGE